MRKLGVESVSSEAHSGGAQAGGRKDDAQRKNAEIDPTDDGFVFGRSLSKTVK